MSRVFVGLSGGVDSAVTAALLKERGYDVTGVFIKIWRPEFIECTWKEDRLDAMRVSVALDIPFREIDLSREYKTHVIDEMLAGYSRGITPNPDVLCNRHIKFGMFSDWALSQGADLVATGHYARIRRSGAQYELLRGRDTGKDQSYFLARLGQDDLAHTFFPIGEYAKSDVRQLAKRYGLPNAEKPDSQGLCFVGDVSMQDFLGRFMSLRNGPVVDTEGKRIGEHRGAALYTVGQRHGFDISEPGPYFITNIDISTNTLRVSRRREDAERAFVSLTDVHWIAVPPFLPANVDVQARYHERPVAARVSKSEKTMRVDFELPHIAAPGQTLAMYQGEVLLGSGTI